MHDASRGGEIFVVIKLENMAVTWLIAKKDSRENVRLIAPKSLNCELVEILVWSPIACNLFTLVAACSLGSYLSSMTVKDGALSSFRYESVQIAEGFLLSSFVDVCGVVPWRGSKLGFGAVDRIGHGFDLYC
ncbi:hypothetical protein Droror1_Dr00025219 [Drosera rotundifolia]